MITPKSILAQSSPLEAHTKWLGQFELSSLTGFLSSIRCILAFDAQRITIMHVIWSRHLKMMIKMKMETRSSSLAVGGSQRKTALKKCKNETPSLRVDYWTTVVLVVFCLFWHWPDKVRSGLLFREPLTVRYCRCINCKIYAVSLTMRLSVWEPYSESLSDWWSASDCCQQIPWRVWEKRLLEHHLDEWFVFEICSSTLWTINWSDSISRTATFQPANAVESVSEALSASSQSAIRVHRMTSSIKNL